MATGFSSIASGRGTAAAPSTNPRTTGNIYNPYNLPTGGYGEGSDPYGSEGAAAGLAAGAAEANLAAAPDIAKISSLINSLNEAQQQQLNAARLGPQGQQIQANLLANTARESAGLLDPATEAMLQQGIAAGGGARGFGVDSPALASAYRRALGETMESTEAQAQKQYIDLLAANPSAPLYDASQQLVSPALYSSTAAQQAQRQIEEQRMAQQAYEFEQRMEAERAALAGKGAGYGGAYRGGAQAGGLPSGGTPSAVRDTGNLYAGGGGVTPSSIPDYRNPFTMNTPSGSSLVWTGQDWSNLGFGETGVGAGAEAGASIDPETGDVIYPSDTALDWNEAFAGGY